jgi:spermidine/putrescine transport system permease protein
MTRKEWLLSFPSLFWMLVLFVVPVILVVLVSFKSVNIYGELINIWSLRAYWELNLSSYLPVIMRTLRLSSLTTIICLIIGLPSSYAMARLDWKSQQLCLLLLIIPFWTNFLIRVYAWKIILHPDGFVKQILTFTGLVAPNATLLYTEGAVLLVLVYTYLPFAILPLYSAAAKFDFGLLDAGQDLGANGWQNITHIYMPGIKIGIINAFLVVFIPALGSYVIPELVGGPTSEMLGNKIAHRVFIDRNLPKASALSTVLLLIIIFPSLLSLFTQLGKGRKKGTFS